MSSISEYSNNDEDEWLTAWQESLSSPVHYRSTIKEQEAHCNYASAHIGKPTVRKGKKLEEYLKDPSQAEAVREKYRQNGRKNGRKNPPRPRPKGYHLSEEHKQLLSQRKYENPVRYWKGKKFSDVHRARLSFSHKGRNNTGSQEYREYKLNGGELMWNEWQQQRKVQRDADRRRARQA